MLKKQKLKAENKNPFHLSTFRISVFLSGRCPLVPLSVVMWSVVPLCVIRYTPALSRRPAPSHRPISSRWQFSAMQISLQPRPVRASRQIGDRRWKIGTACVVLALCSLRLALYGWPHSPRILPANCIPASSTPVSHKPTPPKLPWAILH